MCLFVSIPNLIVKKCEPDKSSGNKSDIICNESAFGLVCGTEVNKILSKQIFFKKRYILKIL